MVVSKVPQLYRKLREACRKNFLQILSKSEATISYTLKTPDRVLKYCFPQFEIEIVRFSLRIWMCWTSDSDSSWKTVYAAGWKRLETPKLVNKSPNLVLDKFFWIASVGYMSKDFARMEPKSFKNPRSYDDGWPDLGAACQIPGQLILITYR